MNDDSEVYVHGVAKRFSGVYCVSLMQTLKPSKLTRIGITIDTGCTRCGVCNKQCAFLREHGTPGEIAEKVRVIPHGKWPDSFECSLCGLCGSVCPEGLKPDVLFLEMRRAKVQADAVDLKRYSPVLFFEKCGDSDLFSLIQLPVGGDTVLFPGCALPATRPKSVRNLYQALKAIIPDVGIALGCCLKPSHDLGRQEFFEERFGQLHDKLISAGVKRVLTTCPNCQKIFNEYGGAIEATTAYEVLADSGFIPALIEEGKVVIHDPCSQRYESGVQNAVRKLTRACGITIEELKERGELTRCCGEGGMVKFVKPQFADNWTRERVNLVAGRRMVTSCAGCVSYLNGSGHIDHILDLMFDSKPRIPLKAPFSYLARLWLKRWFVKNCSR